MKGREGEGWRIGNGEWRMEGRSACTAVYDNRIGYIENSLEELIRKNPIGIKGKEK
jgi:hypothetical protein